MKSLLPVLAFLAPLAHALPEFDTDLVGQCRQYTEGAIAAANRYACGGPAFVKGVTDIDGERYTVDFVQPACDLNGEAELSFGLHEEAQRDGKTLVTRCQLLRVKVTDSGRD